MAIGAPYASSTGTVSMYFYNATGASWDENGSIERSTVIKNGDLFGYSVSVSFDGSTVAIGAPRHTGNNNTLLKFSGAVTVHKYNEDSNLWLQLGDEMIGNSGGDEFGTSVHLSESGNEVAVGSPYSGGSDSPEAGHVSVFEFFRRENSWEKMNIDIAGKSAYNHLGMSVALSGDGQQVIGGAPTEGYATVYQLALTAPPTSSPTPAPPVTKPKKKKNTFGEFIRVVLILALCGIIAFAIFKGFKVYRNRQAGSFEPTTPTDLEMTPHGVPVERDERDVL
jgi:hypothetical protein